MRLKKYQEKEPLKQPFRNAAQKTAAPNVCQKDPDQKAAKKYQEKLSLKRNVRKCCSKIYRSNSSSKISVGECCWKMYLESVPTNYCTQIFAQKTAARNGRQNYH